MRVKEAKCRICRRLGVKLFLRGERCLSPKCAMVKRPYPPGQKGKRRLAPPSEFKRELVEKQKLKYWYGLNERQLKKYVKEVLEKRGKVEDVSALLIQNLEKRLDNVVYRLGFAVSRDQARQLVSHKFFLVNGKPVNIPSFSLKVGDVISLKPQKLKKVIFKDLKERLKKHTPPSWLSLDPEKLEGKVISEPKVEEVAPPVEVSAVFEFYSR
jgi:small subunit ribosomal protein S4